MKFLSRVVRQYFGFSQKEVNGFIILIPLLFLILFSPMMVKSYLVSLPSSQQDEELTKSLVEKINLLAEKKSKPTTKKSNLPVVSPFTFNPNQISQADLEKMGIKQRLASTIINYRSKGGVFRTKNDLSKIYGMSDQLFQKLQPYIDLPDSIVYTARKKKFVEPRPVVLKDINLADAESFKEIRGIGDVLSKRIVAYRNSLGGFHSIDQLSEVYGLNDTEVTRISERFLITDSARISTVDVLSLSEEELRKHPYINYRLAKLIVAYRGQHEMQSPLEIKEIKVLSDSIYEKLLPYLKADSIE